MKSSISEVKITIEIETQVKLHQKLLLLMPVSKELVVRPQDEINLVHFPDPELTSVDA